MINHRQGHNKSILQHLQIPRVSNNTENLKEIGQLVESRLPKLIQCLVDVQLLYWAKFLPEQWELLQIFRT